MSYRKPLHPPDTCAICKQDFTPEMRIWRGGSNGKTPAMAPTVDHIIPISMGGPESHMMNLQWAHYFCNTRKRNEFTPEAVQLLCALIRNHIIFARVRLFRGAFVKPIMGSRDLPNIACGFALPVPSILWRESAP